MAQDGRKHGQPSPPHSTEGDYALEYRHTPVPQHPYTPPRSHLTPHFSYGDPAEFEMAQSGAYYEQPTFYRTPPAPHGSGMKTRSGRSVTSSPLTTASSPASRYSRSPRARKVKVAKKAKAENLFIEEPLSVMTKDYEIPVMDMLVWANRSNEDRFKEIDMKHKGKIPRPMNSFMLYRTAYKERIKKWGQQGENNQLISKVAGLSWPLEPMELKDFYAKCANIERDNHAKAFPHYKFAPNKNVKKRGREDDNDESDPEWDGGSEYGGRKSRRRHDREYTRSASSTPAPIIMTVPTQYHHPSSFQASNPLARSPMVGYDQWGRPIQYTTQIYQPGIGYHFQQPQPGVQYTSAPSYVHQSEYASQLVGMPPATVVDDELLGSHVMDHPELMIDPGLDGFNMDGNYQYGGYQVDQHQPQHEVSRAHDGVQQVEAGILVHPGMQMLTRTDSIWPRTPSGNAFDAEFNRWEDAP